jgi:NADH-quinone oxidoreductase subunit L
VMFQILSAIVSILGIYMAYLLYFRKSKFAESFNKSRISNFFCNGWGFDRVYDVFIVRPTVWLAEIDKNDFIDLLNRGIARIALSFNSLLSATQNGKLRWYLMAFAIGIVFILTYLMNL